MGIGHRGKFTVSGVEPRLQNGVREFVKTFRRTFRQGYAMDTPAVSVILQQPLEKDYAGTFAALCIEFVLILLYKAIAIIHDHHTMLCRILQPHGAGGNALRRDFLMRTISHQQHVGVDHHFIHAWSRLPVACAASRLRCAP
ncbi:MAG: hypothetical protein L0H73_05685 [Nitrococcus sp.]|nr:hypothetical protein [Nitrococcus sp.]